MMPRGIFRLCVFLAVPLYAQETRVLEITGRGYPEENAYNDAREQALKQSGLRLLSTFSELRSGDKSGSSVFRQYYFAGIAAGTILQEDTLQPATLLPGEETGNKAVYEVRLRITVKQRSAEDPYFGVTLKVNPDQTIFHDGDTVSLEAEATKDCFLTIFSVGSDNRLYLVFPNVTQDHNFLKAHSVLPIGGLTMGLLPGTKEASEIIIAVATKENFPFIDFSDRKQWQHIAIREGRFLAFRVAGAATRLAQWLGNLGEDQWTIARLPYSVVK